MFQYPPPLRPSVTAGAIGLWETALSRLHLGSARRDSPTPGISIRDEEIAKAGYYSLNLKRYGIKTERTAAPGRLVVGFDDNQGWYCCHAGANLDRLDFTDANMPLVKEVPLE